MKISTINISLQLIPLFYTLHMFLVGFLLFLVLHSQTVCSRVIIELQCGG